MWPLPSLSVNFNQWWFSSLEVFGNGVGAVYHHGDWWTAPRARVRNVNRHSCLTQQPPHRTALERKVQVASIYNHSDSLNSISLLPGICFHALNCQGCFLHLHLKTTSYLTGKRNPEGKPCALDICQSTSICTHFPSSPLHSWGRTAQAISQVCVWILPNNLLPVITSSSISTSPHHHSSTLVRIYSSHAIF